MEINQNNLEYAVTTITLKKSLLSLIIIKPFDFETL